MTDGHESIQKVKFYKKKHLHLPLCFDSLFSFFIYRLVEDEAEYKPTAMLRRYRMLMNWRLFSKPKFQVLKRECCKFEFSFVENYI